MTDGYGTSARRALARLRGRQRYVLAILVGAALTLAQPPLGWWPVLFPAWSVLAVLALGAESPGSAARVGGAAGFGFFLTGVSWVGQAFLAEAGKVWWYAPVMPLAVALLAAVLAAFWAGGFWLARRLPVAGAWGSVAAFALAMTLAELARGTMLTGFPWALQAYAWTDTPVAQAAALMGAYALSALTVAAACAPAALALGRRGPLAVGAALLAAGWLWGAARLDAALRDDGGAMVRLVQPNIAQADKWEPGATRAIFDRLVSLSAQPSAEKPILVIWPEVAVTFLYDQSPEAQALVTAALGGGAAVAVGSVRRDPEGRLYNSLLFYGPDGAPLGTYDKRRLTPFGEYVPYVAILGRLGIGTLGDGLSGFTPGSEPGPFSLPGLPPAAPLICYEIVFPGEVAAAVGGAAWILQSTNDAWFGDTSGPRQHLAIARMRAIEQGLPVARAANTGVSAMIDAHGRIRASLPLGAQGVVDSPLPSTVAPTPFVRAGNLPLIAIGAIFAAGVLSGVARRRLGAQGEAESLINITF